MILMMQFSFEDSTVGSELIVSYECRHYLAYYIEGPATPTAGPAAIITGTVYVLWTVRTVSPLTDPTETKPVKVGMPVGPGVKPDLIDIFRVTESLSTTVSGLTGGHYAYTKMSQTSDA